MAQTPFCVATQFQAPYNTAVSLANYSPNANDTNATFAQLAHPSNRSLISLIDSGLATTVAGADGFYYGNMTLASGQDQVDLYTDILCSSSFGYLSGVGFTIGDDGTGNNFLEVLTWQGSAATTPGVHITNHVSGSGTDLTDPAQTITPGPSITASISASGLMTVTAVASGVLAIGQRVSTVSGVLPGTYISALGTGTGGTGTYQLSQAPSAAVASTSALVVQNVYTLRASVRGSAGAYTLTVGITQFGGGETILANAIGLPNSFTMIGRYIGLRCTYDQVSGGGTAQNSQTGIHLGNFRAYIYTAGETESAPSVIATATAGSASITPAQAIGGTAPYSYQLQRAPVTGGAVGSYANVGSAQSTSGAPAAITDTGLTVGATYSYQVVVTDSESTPVTVTSPATQFQVPTPGFSIAINPASVVLAQGQSLALQVSASPIGGYSGAPTLSCPTLPAGVTAAFSSPTLSSSGGWQSTLTLTAAGNAATSVSNVQVQAWDGTITQTAPILAYVNAPIGPFSSTTSVQSGDQILLQRGSVSMWVPESTLISYINSGGV